MIIVNINGFLTEFTAGQRQLTVEGAPATVAQALAQLWQAHEGLRDRVVNEQGQVRQHVNIFLNSENLRYQQGLQTPVADGAEITILPAVSGGSTGIRKPRAGSESVDRFSGFGITGLNHKGVLNESNLE